MELDALLGRYNRLKRELADAYQSLPWQSGQIDRLADDLVCTEREIAACQSGASPAASLHLFGATLNRASA